MKIFTSLFIAGLLFAPLVPVSAQEVTRADVKVVAPQIASLLGTLSLKLGFIDANYQAQNMALRQLIPVLSTFSNVVGVYGSSKTEAQLEPIKNTIGGITGIISDMVHERQTVAVTLDGIVNSMAGIVNVLASAK